MTQSQWNLRVIFFTTQKSCVNLSRLCQKLVIIVRLIPQKQMLKKIEKTLMRFPENCIFVKIVTFGARQLLEQPKYSHP